MHRYEPRKILFEIFQKEFSRFLIVGSFITITNILLIFVFYNVFNWGYWASSATGYAIVTIISYCLNKKYTFNFQNDNILTMIKFVMVIACCYLFSYLIAKPMTYYIVGLISRDIAVSTIEQIAMLVGMIGSIAFNYMGQKTIVFR